MSSSPISGPAVLATAGTAPMTSSEEVSPIVA
jgi:hypothetical protein